jgi:N-acetyl-1-D-myo-inositol-2-amino-2-deoxy-alpha-D-glucopyranoside deacetylase
LQGFETPGDMRWAELTCAAKELGLTDLIYLGYRDSGMPGSPDNQHPNALAAAPLDEVTAKVVGVIRDLKPQVVITFDPIGGYRHPDHIAIHNATVRAFYAAGDSAQFPDYGPAFAPQKLYFQIFPRGYLKWAVRILSLIRRDPRRFGRNQDIDLISLTEVDFPVHAVVRFNAEATAMQQRAAACHRSQLAGGPPSNGLLGFLARLNQRQDMFMRAHPSVPMGGRFRERDLFEGIK